MTEAVLDQNLVEVEWGLLGAVGVVITLMIPKATEYFQAFKETASTMPINAPGDGLA